MEFVLRGFKQDASIRRYSFQGIAGDRTRTEFTICADLVLARKYKIPLQELPLLCRNVLEGQLDGGQDHALTFTEQDMVVYATRRAAEVLEAEQKKRAHHRPPPPSGVGKGWRTQPPPSRV